MNVQALLSDENGATAVEYGLMLALIAVGIVGALNQFQDNVNAMYEYVSATLVAELP